MVNAPLREAVSPSGSLTVTVNEYLVPGSSEWAGMSQVLPTHPESRLTEGPLTLKWYSEAPAVRIGCRGDKRGRRC